MAQEIEPVENNGETKITIQLPPGEEESDQLEDYHAYAEGAKTQEAREKIKIFLRDQGVLAPENQESRFTKSNRNFTLPPPGEPDLPEGFGFVSSAQISPFPQADFLIDDVIKNLVEIPANLTIDATIQFLNESLQFGRSLDKLLQEQGIPTGGTIQLFDEEGDFNIDLLSSEEAGKLKKEGVLGEAVIPHLTEAETPTGKISRELGSGLIPFTIFFKGLKSLKQAGKILKKEARETGGVITKEAVEALPKGPLKRFLEVTRRGGKEALERLEPGTAAVAAFITEAVTRDPYEQNLATFLQEFPKLQAIVPGYLSDTNPENNSEWDLRLKNGLIASGLGVIVDAGLSLFKAYKSARALYREEGIPKVNPIEKELLENEKALNDADAASPVFPEQLEGNIDSVDFFNERAKEKLTRAAERVQGKLRGGETAPVDINFHNFETPEDLRKLAEGLGDRELESFKVEIKGKRSRANLLKRVNEAGIDLAEILGRDVKDLTEEMIVGAGKAFGIISERIRVLHAMYKNDPSNVNGYNLMQALTFHSALQSELKGAGTQAGRLLDAFKVNKNDPSQRLGAAISKKLEDSGGFDSMDGISKNLDDAMDEKQIAAVAKNLPKYSEAAYSLYVNNILSGFKTIAIQPLSNSLRTLELFPKRLLQASISQTIGTGQITFRELGELGWGMAKGLKEGVIIAGSRFAPNTFMRNAPDYLIDRAKDFGGQSRFDKFRFDALSHRLFDMDPDTFSAKFADATMLLFNWPTKAIAGLDDLSKAVLYRGQIGALSLRQTFREGLEEFSPEFSARLLDLKTNPPRSMHLSALDFAEEAVFQNKVGPRAEALFKSIDKIGPLRVLAPFKRTLFNTQASALRESPLFFTSDRIKRQLAAGGATAEATKSNIAFGTGMLFVGTDLYFEGRITGPPPTDPAMKEAWRLAGKKPWTIKIFDWDVAYNRLDPWGSYFQFVSTIGDSIMNSTEEESLDLISNAIMHQWDFWGDKSFTQGIVQFIAAMSRTDFSQNPLNYLIGMSQNLLLPNWLRQWAQVQDPRSKITRILSIREFDKDSEIPLALQKMQKEFMNQVYSKVPYYGDNPPMHDYFGRPITNVSGLGMGYDLISPLTARPRETDPDILFILENEMPLSPVSRQISRDNITVRLTPKEWSDLQKLTGEFMEPVMRGLINSPGFKEMNRFQQSEMWEEREADVREIALQVFEGISPQLQEALDAMKLERFDKLTAPKKINGNSSAPQLPVEPAAANTSKDVIKMLGGG